MEESIKRAENLIHATNSALAQMKYNLIFDDLNGVPGVVPKFQNRRKGKCERKRTNKEDSSLEDDFKEFEHDFMTEANEMLMKMDKLLEPDRFSSARKASKARDKMKEINAKLESRRLEQLIGNQTEQNRQKLLNQIAHQETTPCKKACSSKESETSKQTPIKEDSVCRGKEASPGKSEPLSGLASRQKSKEDLKMKLLETQEIVDRGFQTARQLTQKVENMTKATSDKKSERTPASEKTFLTEVTNTRSSERIETSSELGKTSNRKKCSKCHRVKEVRKKGEEREKESKESKEEREGRIGIVDIKRQERRRLTGGPRLKVQRLPSLHIKGGLQVQRVHNLEILPQTEEGVPSRVNTSIKIISHDHIEKEKAEMCLRDIRRENCFCGEAEVQSNCIECFNCGKLIRIREHPVVDPREIDKLLLECNFNVFDPRIDEFVEKCKQPGALIKFSEEEKAEVVEKNVIKEKSDVAKVRESEGEERKENMKKKKVIDSMRRRFKIKELSEELSRKYKKKAEELEDDHLQFENFLRDLFKKVDESREFFESCRLLTTTETQRDSSSTKLPQLSVTKPVIISFVEEDEHHEPEKREDKQLSDRQEVMVKEKKKKLDKKDVKNKLKSRTRVQQDLLTDEEDNEDKTKPSKKHFRRKEASKKPEEEKDPPKLPPVATQIFKEIQSSHATKDQIGNKEVKEIWPMGVNLWRSSSSEESDRNADKEDLVKTSVSEEKTENDYDSDFEAESGEPTLNNEVIQNSEEDEDYVEDREEDQAIIRCMKKLSTISEVDSELERKLSELEPKSETPEKQKTNSKSEGGSNSMEMPEDCQIDDDVKVTQNQKVESMDVRSASSLEIKTSKTGKRKEEERVEEEAATKNVSPSKSSRSLKDCQTKESKESCLSRESSSTDMVASIKEVLSALKDQFARTQSLADKLTENVKELKTEREVEKPEIVKAHEEEKRDVFSLSLMSGDLDSSLVSNLQKLRKDLNVPVGNPRSPLSILSRAHNLSSKTCEPRTRSRRKCDERKRGGSESSLSEGVFSDEAPSSLGELNLNDSKGDRMASDRKRKGSEKSESSSASECSLVKLSSRKKSSWLASGKSEHRNGRDPILPLALGPNDDEMYSEGEVRSDGILDDDLSSMQSIGEVISEHISAESSFK